MPLSGGQRLGPYEIISPLGAGGMGEVYKARDTRLERLVAIKVLPANLAADPEFKARFEREARSISALSHPHICTLFDVGVEDGASFLVMECLDGETLADRLKKGPLPLDQALHLASQIADALDKAHRQGIVHRDLKPANVFLVRAVGASGSLHCKLLDFGLAKMGVVPAPGSIETRLLTASQSPAGGPLTSQGSLLGTFQYMAPEQIESGEADARADIWAFGCVLYEMLTGKRAFEGKSQASLIASILEKQPTAMSELQPMTPPALDRVVRTCLEKNPDNRFHTAHDLWLHLQWIEEGGSQASVAAPVIATRKRRDRLVFGAGAIALAAFAAIAAWMLKPAPPPPANFITRFNMPLPDGQGFTRTGRRVVAISPDGLKIAYIANQQIYLRRLSELEAQPVRGTDVDPLDVVFSADGESLGFFVPDPNTANAGAFKKISVTGGKAIPLVDGWPGYGAKWQGHTVVLSLGSRIVSIPDAGGQPTELAKLEAGDTELAQPQIVGDGRYLLYTVSAGSFNDARIVVQPLGGGPRRVLVDGGMDGRILPTGHLIWVRDGTLYAQVIDPHTLELTGGRIVLISGMRLADTSGVGELAVADNGTLVFVPGAIDTNADLLWVDRSGRVEPTGAPPKKYTYPRLSPDGTRIAVNTTDVDGDVWIWDLARKNLTRLTAGPEQDIAPVWSLDGRSVIYASDSHVAQGVPLYRRAADGTGGAEKLTEDVAWLWPEMVLADGRLLARSLKPNTLTQGTMVVVPLSPGAAAERVFPSTLGLQVNAEVSPDRRWIAYESREGSTRNEVHVRPFPKTDSGHWQISTRGGAKPLWSRSGHELFYLTPNPIQLLRVEVQPRSDGVFSVSPPQEVFSMVQFRPGAIGRAWDISLDDKRFLMVRPIGADVARDSLTVVTHWFDELRATVKAK